MIFCNKNAIVVEFLSAHRPILQLIMWLRHKSGWQDWSCCGKRHWRLPLQFLLRGTHTQTHTVTQWQKIMTLISVLLFSQLAKEADVLCESDKDQQVLWDQQHTYKACIFRSVCLKYYRRWCVFVVLAFYENEKSLHIFQGKFNESQI